MGLGSVLLVMLLLNILLASENGLLLKKSSIDRYNIYLLWAHHWVFTAIGQDAEASLRDFGTALFTLRKSLNFLSSPTFPHLRLPFLPSFLDHILGISQDTSWHYSLTPHIETSFFLLHLANKLVSLLKNLFPFCLNSSTSRFIRTSY